MSARVSTTDVQQILDTDMTSTQIRAFLTTANVIVDSYLQESWMDLTSDELKQIELYLAAHLCTLRDPRAVEEKVGEARIRYGMKTGLGLDSSVYGQTVKMLDRTGVLAEIDNKKKRAFMEAITF